MYRTKQFKAKLFVAVLGMAALIVGVGAMLWSPPSVLAVATDAQSEVCDAIGSGKQCDQNSTGSASVEGVIRLVVRIFGIVVGVAAVIMIILSGLKYITSGGESSKIASAKNTLIYALVGLVIVALSQVIVRFVLSSASNTASCPPGQSHSAGGSCVMKVEKL